PDGARHRRHPQSRLCRSGADDSGRGDARRHRGGPGQRAHAAHVRGQSGEVGGQDDGRDRRRRAPEEAGGRQGGSPPGRGGGGEVHQPRPVAAEGEAANAGKRGGAGGRGRRGAGADLSGKFLRPVGNLSGAGASNGTRPGTERGRNGRSGRRAMRSGGGAGVSSGGRGEGAAGNKQEQPEAARRSGATAGTAAGTAAGAVRAEADRAARLPSVDELYQRYERFNRLYFENLLPRADDVT